MHGQGGRTGRGGRGPDPLLHGDQEGTRAKVWGQPLPAPKWVTSQSKGRKSWVSPWEGPRVVSTSWPWRPPPQRPWAAVIHTVPSREESSGISPISRSCRVEVRWDRMWGELRPRRDTQECSRLPLGKRGPLSFPLGAVPAPPRASLHPRASRQVGSRDTCHSHSRVWCQIMARKSHRPAPWGPKEHIWSFPGPPTDIVSKWEENVGSNAGRPRF